MSMIKVSRLLHCPANGVHLIMDERTHHGFIEIWSGQGRFQVRLFMFAAASL